MRLCLFSKIVVTVSFTSLQTMPEQSQKSDPKIRLVEHCYQGQKRQRIAVWTLLYRLQLPCTYERRVRPVLVQITPRWLELSSMTRPEKDFALLLQTHPCG